MGKNKKEKKSAGEYVLEEAGKGLFVGAFLGATATTTSQWVVYTNAMQSRNSMLRNLQLSFMVTATTATVGAFVGALSGAAKAVYADFSKEDNAEQQEEADIVVPNSEEDAERKEKAVMAGVVSHDDCYEYAIQSLVAALESKPDEGRDWLEEGFSRLSTKTVSLAKSGFSLFHQGLSTSSAPLSEVSLDSLPEKGYRCSLGE